MICQFVYGTIILSSSFFICKLGDMRRVFSELRIRTPPVPSSVLGFQKLKISRPRGKQGTFAFLLKIAVFYECTVISLEKSGMAWYNMYNITKRV